VAFSAKRYHRKHLCRRKEEKEEKFKQGSAKVIISKKQTKKLL
jgi:hypothetical protein